MPKGKKPIEQYDHRGKQRANNPPVGLVTPETDPDTGKKNYSYDPHLDPQLVWAGKAEHTSFEVPTVSLHVHERIDPRTIIEAVRKRNGNGQGQISFFDRLGEKPPLREAIEFYKHRHGWTNRLVAGDSLLVMNSLLEKEGLASQVQMIYIDPPYGIKYGSNFQPFVNKRDVKDGADEDLTAEPEMIKAFRDTWELGLHSYLTYLRDRFLLAKELLHPTGSIFVQIGDENVHLVRSVLDEVFVAENFIGLIIFRKKMMPLGARLLESVSDCLMWYSRDIESVKFRRLFVRKDIEGDSAWSHVEETDGARRRMTKAEIASHSLLPAGCRIFQPISLLPAGFNASCVFSFEFEGRKFSPKPGQSWATNSEGIQQLIKHRRIYV